MVWAGAGGRKRGEHFSSVHGVSQEDIVSFLTLIVEKQRFRT